MAAHDYLQKQITIKSKQFAKWLGGSARLWSYTVSHKMLVIRITREGMPGSLDISCGDVSQIHCPTGWEDIDLQIEIDETVGSGAQAGFRLIDRKRDAWVACGVIETKESG